MTGINVTPLIDVLLVLFIVFLVIVLAGRRTLPVAMPPEAGTSTTQILLDITPSGDYRLNDQPIPADLLGSVLQGALKLHSAKVVFIRAAPERAYQDFITAADIARGAGATIVAMMGR